MDDVGPIIQRIERLTPLADVLARIDALVAPVAPSERPIEQALGLVLAADIRVDRHPAVPLALRDGYAVRSEETGDAGSYAPAPLSLASRLDVGDPLPPTADAVAPIDAVDDRARPPQALAPVAPGEGVLAAGQDTDPATPVLSSGRRLHSVDLAVLAAVGITRVAVRVPAVRVATVRQNPVAHAIASLLAGLIAPAATVESSRDVDAVLLDAGDADAIIIIGGSGSGTRDDSVRLLARAGCVEAHGIGLSPGETAAFGRIDSTPVLIVPGRLDAALAVWHVIGARMLARLAGAESISLGRDVVLRRKIASAVGLVEFVPVRPDGDAIVPLASGYLPWRALAEATGYVLVPASSEGFAAGTIVRVLPL
jgi:molybdopterin molybdotransferase